MRVHRSTVHRVHACPHMFTWRVHVGCRADKLGLIDEAIGCRTDLALVDELIERGPGDAELAGACTLVSLAIEGPQWLTPPGRSRSAAACAPGASRCGPA